MLGRHCSQRILLAFSLAVIKTERREESALHIDGEAVHLDSGWAESKLTPPSRTPWVNAGGPQLGIEC